MQLVVRQFNSGERAPFLLDERGIPLYWPTLFATAELRNGGLTANTIKAKLNDLKTLLRWEAAHDRDLTAEFRSGQLLTPPDVTSIRDFAAKKRGRVKSTPVTRKGSVASLETRLAPVTPAPVVSKKVHYNRLTTIAQYLHFVGERVTAQRADKELAAAVDRMKKLLLEHRPRGMSSPWDEDVLLKCPPTALVLEYIRVGSEGHLENPFRRGPIQRRNELMFRVLYETGIRLGELLSLRLDSIDLGSQPEIKVTRNHDDGLDPRAYQPVAKTMERYYPIDAYGELHDKLENYIKKDRARTPGAKRHPYLFVTHRKGETCGQPLSLSTVGNKVFRAMQRVRPEFAGIRPHSFRHLYNYRASQAFDDHNRRVRSGEDPTGELISPGREARIRADMNGHRDPKSGEVYNRRHIRNTSDKIALELQKELMKGERPLRPDDHEQ